LGGGGISCRKSRPEIINNVITANSADSAGGGLHFEKGGDALVSNSIILGNGAGSGYEISIGGGKPEFKYCNVPEEIDGEGNIEAEPYFRDAEKGDFRLMSVACGDPLDSPCVDAGDPAVLDGNTDCNAGLGTNRSDMGAFGGDRRVNNKSGDIPEVNAHSIILEEGNDSNR
jgi:hypothetical protein